MSKYRRHKVMHPVTYPNPVAALEAAGRMQYYDPERARSLLFRIIAVVVEEDDDGQAQAS